MIQMNRINDVKFRSPLISGGEISPVLISIKTLMSDAEHQRTSVSLKPIVKFRQQFCSSISQLLRSSSKLMLSALLGRNERQRLIRRQHMPVTNHPVTPAIAIFPATDPATAYQTRCRRELKRDEMCGMASFS